MPREPAFDAFYRESYDRLWVQVYAYAGDVDTTQRAVTSAYAAASQHWRSVMQSGDREAWIRDKAFDEVQSGRTSSREPWFVKARKTSDQHRSLLRALGSLRPVDRALLICKFLADLDTGAAAREVGLTVNAAQASLDASTASIGRAGLDSSTNELAASLRALSSDQPAEDADPAALRIKTRRRRRFLSGLVTGVAALVLAMSAAWAWTSASSGDDSADQEQPGTTSTASTNPTPSTSAAPAPPPFGKSDLVGRAEVARLDPDRSWQRRGTSSDFGSQEPPDVCVDTVPQPPDTDHYWVRKFGTKSSPRATTATQTLQIAASAKVAAASYSALVRDFATCGPEARQLVAFNEVPGAGDGGTTVSQRFVDADGVHNETAAIGRSGTAVVLWIIRARPTRPVELRPVAKLLGSSLDAVCSDAGGTCPDRRLRVENAITNAPGAEGGFLTTSDLPVLDGVPKPWAATASVRTSVPDPAATVCAPETAISTNAARARTRTYVIPDATRLPSIFGISQTRADFDARRDATGYLESASAALASCEQRVPGVTLTATDQIGSDRLGFSGFTAEIEQATSADDRVVFRTAVVQVRTSITEITFTPGDPATSAAASGTSQTAFTTLITRAAQRLIQTPAN